MRMLVLADDLTGALEVGAQFASEGIPSLVSTELSLSPPQCYGMDVLVIDTESRHISPSDAGRRIRILAAVARERNIPHVYKKTDSTLRGNLAAELAALSTTFGGSPVIYVPAYPAMGRTVDNGRLLVNGRPVSETESGSDALNPIHESHIPSLLQSRGAPAIRSGPALQPGMSVSTGIYVCDGKTDADVELCARHYLNNPLPRLAAGPAAFARSIAAQADWPRKKPECLPTVERCLIVCGSRSEVSARQLAHAQSSGFPAISSSAGTLPSPASFWLILPPEAAPPGSPHHMARIIGGRVRDFVQKWSPDGIFVIGGDTAHAVVRELGSQSLLPIGEVLPGVPLARIEPHNTRKGELFLISKAGGFGPIDVIPQIARVLRRF